jgi:hypothetical protein
VNIGYGTVEPYEHCGEKYNTQPYWNRTVHITSRRRNHVISCAEREVLSAGAPRWREAEVSECNSGKFERNRNVVNSVRFLASRSFWKLCINMIVNNIPFTASYLLAGHFKTSYQRIILSDVTANVESRSSESRRCLFMELIDYLITLYKLLRFIPPN